MAHTQKDIKTQEQELLKAGNIIDTLLNEVRVAAIQAGDEKVHAGPHHGKNKYSYGTEQIREGLEAVKKQYTKVTLRDADYVANTLAQEYAGRVQSALVDIRNNTERYTHRYKWGGVKEVNERYKDFSKTLENAIKQVSRMVVTGQIEIVGPKTAVDTTVNYRKPDYRKASREQSELVDQRNALQEKSRARDGAPMKIVPEYYKKDYDSLNRKIRKASENAGVRYGEGGKSEIVR